MSSTVLTLVFTDLKGSTSLKAEKGGDDADELIARHREHVKRLAVTNGGRIIDCAGDGCFLTFETPSAAVLFALRLQQIHHKEPDLPKVYTGINMGEVTEHTGPVGKEGPPRVEGLAVDTAARIQSLALPGQILMSSAVFNTARQRLSNSLSHRRHGEIYKRNGTVSGDSRNNVLQRQTNQTIRRGTQGRHGT